MVSSSIEDPIDKLLETIDYESLKVLREKSKRKLSSLRLRGRVVFHTYLAKEYTRKFEDARDWAYENKFIPKNSRWAFTKFALMNVIDTILNEKEKAKQLTPLLNPDEYAE